MSNRDGPSHVQCQGPVRLDHDGTISSKTRITAECALAKGRPGGVFGHSTSQWSHPGEGGKRKREKLRTALQRSLYSNMAAGNLLARPGISIDAAAPRGNGLAHLQPRAELLRNTEISPWNGVAYHGRLSPPLEG